MFEISEDEGMVLTEMAEGENVEDIVEATGCEFTVSRTLLKVMIGDVCVRTGVIVCVCVCVCVCVRVCE